MREAHPREVAVGMAHYVSETDGTGGHLRASPDDFRVVELEGIEPEPVDADPGAYPTLVVRATLTGWDTNDLARRLANELEISRERVSWAGTKDKRAVTTQLLGIDGVDPAALPAIDRADLDVVGRFGRRLHFGDLWGNAFDIAIADADAPERLPAILAELAAFAGDEAGTGEHRAPVTEDGDRDGDGSPSDRSAQECTVRVGVPNLFGQQRFGSRRPITHAVGLELLRGDWEGAAMTYIAEAHEAEPEATRAAREFAAETREWSSALERFPGGLRYERAMLHVLEGSGPDPTEERWRAALDALPRSLQQLFVHAAQSYAFNRILSARLERGLPFDRPVAGDVVCFADREGPPALPASHPARSILSERQQEGLETPDPDRTQRVTASRVGPITRHCERGRAFVTAPLVGTETELGAGEPGEIERSVLADLELEPADFDLPEPYGSTGTRRAILVRPVVRARTDPPRLAFALPSGAYATTLLREVLKVDPTALG